MGKRYDQLGIEERSTIAVGLAQGLSRRAMARLLKRPPSTISREIRRNTPQSGVYTAPEAALQHRQRHTHRRPVFATRPTLWPEVEAGMRRGWSPEQVSGMLKRMHADHPTRRVSHETIYAHIYAYPRGELRTDLIALLRQSHKTRRPRARGEDRRGQLIDIRPISDRPPEVESRLIPGHWEGDLIKGAYNRSAVGSLVERTSRYLILVQLDDAKAPTVCQGFTREMQDVPPLIRKTLTYDRGKEMANHKQLEANLDLTVYFADPHAPWQRGSNENTNGLVRQYLPKGTDLTPYSQAQLTEIANNLNTRPRKKLGFFTPEEIYLQNMTAYTNQSGVALHV